MKLFKYLIVITILSLGASTVFAIRGVVINDNGMRQLKKALREGQVVIDQTRLSEIRDEYGDAPSIIEDDRRLVYDYNDFRLEFTKYRYWKFWEYDTFRDAVYTQNIDDLRFDLESEELVGMNITYRKIRKDYGEPTESDQTDEDGRFSVYYYGDIKMVFENTFLLTSWRASNLQDSEEAAVLESQR